MAFSLFSLHAMSKNKESCTRNGKFIISFLTFLGSFLIVFGLVLRPVLDKLIQEKINKQLILTPGSDVYKAWLKPGGEDSVPMYTKFYVFDIKNRLEIHDGAKPVVEQRGPYSYREYKEKENITWYNENSTVSYNEKSWFIFDHSASCHGCDPARDSVYTPNMPMIILAQLTLSFSDFLHWRDLVSVLFEYYNERLFIRRSVHEVLFGYKDPIFELYVELKKKHPFLSFLPDLNPVFLMQPNETFAGTTEVHTGASHIADLLRWVKWRGENDVGLWKSKYANMINGSDGTQFPPGTIQKDSRLYLFLTQLCRSIYMTYENDVELDGIKALKFTVPATIFLNGSIYPENKAFCPYECYTTGILDTSSCQPNSETTMPFKMRSPILVSAPHFYHGDPKLVEAVDGLKPDQTLHETFFSVEPHTGIPIDGAMRLQLNAHIQPIKDITQTRGLQEVILPIIYFSGGARINSDKISLMKGKILDPLAVLHGAEYAAVGTGSFLILVAILSVHRCVKKRKLDKIKRNLSTNTADEQTPLVR